MGAIAWYNGPGMGHVAYVARVNWSNHTVFLVSDNYAASTGAGWHVRTPQGVYRSPTPTGYIHLRDLSAPSPAARRLKPRAR